MQPGAQPKPRALQRATPVEVQTILRGCTQRLAGMQSARYPYEPTWRELVKFLMPYRGRLRSTTPQPNDTARGRLRQDALLDRMATRAAQNLAAFLQRGITSPARPWFRLTLADQDIEDDGAVRAYLDEVRVRMMAVFQASNFYTSMASVYEELLGFGTAACIIVQDYDDVIRCHPMTIGEYFLMTDARGKAGALYRQFTMTCAQLVERFGLENVPAHIRVAFENNQRAQEFAICHAIERNDQVQAGALGWRGMPWRSVWWEIGRTEEAFEVGGFWRMPVIAPRWDVVANDTYGHGPGENALPDIKTLQVLRRDRMLASAKHARPPLVGSGSLLGGQIDDNPGAVNILPGVQGGQLAPLYAVPPHLQSLDGDILETRQSIREAFWADLIAMFADSDRREMTAAEVRARQEEKMLLLGPMLDRFQDEALTPAIEIVFDIMSRGGLLPEPPPIMRGRFVMPDYVSLLAQAQKASDTVAIERVLAFAGNLLQASPELGDKIDFDESLDLYADALGASPRMIRSDQAVAQMREQRARLAAQERQLQQAQATAGLLEQGAKGAELLSKTEVGGGANLLGTILGNA